MLNTTGFSSQHLLKCSILLNPVGNIVMNHSHNTILVPTPRFSSPSTLPSHKTVVLRPIIYSRNKRKESGNLKFRRILPKLLPIIAPSIKILPELLDLLSEAIVAHDAPEGLLRLCKGFGAKRLHFWRRKWKSKSGHLGVFLLFGLGLFFLFFGRDIKSNLIAGAISLLLIGAALTKILRNGVKNLVLGFCFLVALMRLGLKTRG